MKCVDCKKLLVGLLPVFTAIIFAQPGAAENVLVVRQFNGYTGGTVLYLGKESSKFEARSGNLNVYCSGPDWTVIVYRKDDKRAMVVPLDQWVKTGFKVMPPKEKLIDATVTTVRVPVINQTCKEFVLKSNRRLFESNDPVMFRSNTSKNVKEIRCITTRGVVLQDKMKKFIHGLYNQPWTDEIPLDLKNVLSDGSEICTYKIQSIKQETVPAGFFAYPKNYAVVTRREDILASKKEEKKARQLLDTLINEYQQRPIKDKK